MLPPDRLAYELGHITTPVKIENTKIATYILIGVTATIAVGIFSYVLYQLHEETTRKNLN